MTQTATHPIPDVQLDAHTSIPQIGFGTYQIPAVDTQKAVEQALEIGYRHIDTAAAYYNEHEVGLAIKATGMADSVFITSKLRNCDQGFDAARFAFDRSLSKLGVDRLDLYLIHWPFPAVDQYTDTWKALLSLKSDGRIRTAGVSNFLPPICKSSSTKPARRPRSTSWKYIPASHSRKRCVSAQNTTSPSKHIRRSAMARI